jgi:DNA-binding response OmpR family regulator/two-component sensor histidine kinase
VQDALAGAFGDVPAPLRQQLENMRRHVGRLRRLANQLLDLSRLETAEPSLDPEPRDLVAFTENLVQAYAPQADRRGIRLTTTMGPNAHLCRFDPEKLETALGNLLANALQYTPRGGTVTVRLDLERTDEPQAPPTAVIAVEDTGRGIPLDQQDQIFERFACPTPLDGDKSGTGIGLALAREYVQMHDGSILLDSVPGEGSTFTLRLPLPPTDPDEDPSGALAPADALPASPAGDGAPTADGTRNEEGPDGPVDPNGEPARTLLVADDNADVRAYLRRHLAPHWTVQEAANGAEALDQIHTEPPDLVLADVMMPELDGLELTRKVRGNENLNRIPVILLTARADEDDAVAGLEAGADDYVTKPFSMDELRARIEQLLAARHAWTDPATADRLLAPEVEMTDADEAFLDRVTTALDEHLSRSSLTVDDLAAEVGLSARQLQRRLKRLTGCTAAAFIRRYRVECGATLLEDGATSVSRVAYRVGFGTPETFAKHFAKHFDCPPSTYAHRHDADPPDAPE